ncbi:hypothetical protein EIP91_001062 [Steccherinum ochraceum]|uniref:Uncharacterized protein n=1 Tax=Steccherinum ochraceum TaxID=92696 RepID=A0A4R0RL19_9APHY|nr:hypothetical protein EIP91_001062 [Steccherinum ochraceum]
MQFLTGFILALPWLIVNGLDGVWQFFYVKACVDPNPRTAVNRTHSGFIAFQVMMFIFGFALSAVNLLIFRIYYGAQFDSKESRPSAKKWALHILVVFPVMLFFAVMPAFGGWIVVPIAQNWAWNHRCDSYPMYAILDAKSTKDAAFTPNIAHFYQTGSSQSLFSFSVNSDSSSDLWTFHFRELDAPQTTTAADRIPSLQRVDYDFVNDTLTGTCTTSASSNSSMAVSTPCVSGSFNPTDWLSFTLASNVTLVNSTSPASPRNIFLRTVDQEWSFSNDAPSLILDTVDPNLNTLGQTVLRTAVTKRGDCTQLKVCLNGIDGVDGSVVGAEVMAPLGLILIRQADYALQCTGRRKNSN